MLEFDCHKLIINVVLFARYVRHIVIFCKSILAEHVRMIIIFTLSKGLITWQSCHAYYLRNMTVGLW